MVAIDVSWAPIPLRLLLAAIFLVHGYPKLFKDFKGTAGFLAGLGFKPGIFWAFVLGVTEFVGAFALLLGFASRVVAGLLIVSMSVATLLKIFKWKAPFTKQGETGWEFDALIVAALITLFLLGSGTWSIDQAVGWMPG
ncbi:DoxX family protein [Candidatus Woesearchaeota archaeon]|nr:DoxX family protein [Candidatus Woesearchaeota archaeon]